jgi:catechol 2,3-dioxygenase-like lactoylglutathione lyase family enzyme
VVKAISHLTFVVADLERATLFFTRMLDAREIYSSGDATFSLAREKFFLVGSVWIVAMEGNTHLDRTYDHTAFQVSSQDLDMYEARARELGLEIRTPRDRVEGEGRSLYVYDFDNHLFELHAGEIEERLERYRRGP